MSTESLDLEILADGTAIARRAAEILAEQARAAIERSGRFYLALSGGRTPAAMFGCLAEVGFPWEQTAIFQVDERVAPRGHHDRNLTLLLNSLPANARADIHPMPVESADLASAAADYAGSLPKSFDVIHLGLGADGHTASLVPGDPALRVDDRDVAITQPYMGRARMTLTYPVLNRARRLLWLISGAEKSDALARLLAADESIPAGHVERSRALILADLSAADAAH